jgi:hypothetical protein
MRLAAAQRLENRGHGFLNPRDPLAMPSRWMSPASEDRTRAV